MAKKIKEPFVAIPRRIYDALVKAKLSGAEAHVFLAIIGLTLGWVGKHAGAFISVSKLMKLTRFSARAVCRAQNSLLRKGLITCLKDSTNRDSRKWGVNAEVESWECWTGQSASPSKTDVPVHQDRSASPDGQIRQSGVDRSASPDDSKSQSDNELQDRKDISYRNSIKDKGKDSLLSSFQEAFKKELGTTLSLDSFIRSDFERYCEESEETGELLLEAWKALLREYKRDSFLQKQNPLKHFMRTPQYVVVAKKRRQGFNLNLYQTILNNYGAEAAQDYERSCKRKPKLHTVTPEEIAEDQAAYKQALERQRKAKQVQQKSSAVSAPHCEFRQPRTDEEMDEFKNWFASGLVKAAETKSVRRDRGWTALRKDQK